MKNPYKRYSKISPQRENGNRQICNSVYSALMAGDFKGAEYKIILAIIDKTWGFKKSSDAISISQLCKMTNLQQRTVKRTLKNLKEKRVVYVSPSNRRVSSGSPLNEILFNKHYDTWKIEGCQIVQGRQVDHPPQASKGDNRCQTRVSIEPPTKETITIKDKTIAFDRFWASYPVGLGRKAAVKAWKKVTVDIEILLAAIEKQKRWREAGEGFIPEWKHAATWLNGECWDDEIKEVKKNGWS